jgi:tetratricopeptide (TPR) repeat protein
MSNLALLYQNQGRLEEAEPLCVKALETRRRVLGEEHTDTLTSMNNLAVLYGRQGRFEEAEPLHLEALETRWKVLGEEHADTAASMNNLAQLYKVQGRFEEAKPLYLQAIKTLRRLLGEEHPKTLMSTTSLAVLYLETDRNAKAVPLFQQLVKCRLGEPEKAKGRLATDMYLLALCHLSLGQEVEYQRTCQDMLKVLGGEKDMGFAKRIAWTCSLHAEAVKDWSPIVELARQAAKAEPESLRLANTLGTVLWRAGDTEQAIEVLQCVADQLGDEPTTKETSPAYTWFVLAMACHQHGDGDQARQWCEKANRWTGRVLQQHESGEGPKLPWNRRWTLQRLRDEAASLLQCDSSTPRTAKPGGDADNVP